MNDQIEVSDVPAEILAAAEKVRLWAETNGLKYWQLGGICDRRFAKSQNAFLEIITTCEDFQNRDTESMELEEQCDDGYRTICKVISIASGRLLEIESHKNRES